MRRFADPRPTSQQPTAERRSAMAVTV